MENNTGYKNKSTGEQITGQKFSTSDPAHRGDNHVIGLGYGGARAAIYAWQQWVRGGFTVVSDPQNAEVPDGIHLIRFRSPRIRVYSGRMGEFSLPDMDEPLHLPEELNQVLSEEGRFILLAALGGYTGTKMAEALSLRLQSEQKDFVVLCSLPFRFEGRTRNRIAREALERMKTIPDCHSFALDSLRTANPGMLLSEAFRAGDEAFYRFLVSIL